jgi:hypothetical protein
MEQLAIAKELEVIDAIGYIYRLVKERQQPQ